MNSKTCNFVTKSSSEKLESIVYILTTYKVACKILKLSD